MPVLCAHVREGFVVIDRKGSSEVFWLLIAGSVEKGSSEADMSISAVCGDEQTCMCKPIVPAVAQCEPAGTHRTSAHLGLSSVLP